jgi:hypothetical protein
MNLILFQPCDYLSQILITKHGRQRYEMPPSVNFENIRRVGIDFGMPQTGRFEDGLQMFTGLLQFLLHQPHRTPLGQAPIVTD